MPARKTYPVDRIKAMINERLVRPEISSDAKNELISLLEVVLHETGNYRGFQYPGVTAADIFNGNYSETIRRYF